MNVVNSISVNIFAGLIKQLKLYIQQKAATDSDSDEVFHLLFTLSSTAHHTIMATRYDDKI